MNDEKIEQHLRGLFAPELPESWRAEILSAAVSKASRQEQSRQIWPAILVYLRGMFSRNPITAGALTTLWLLIFLFKAGTPSESASERMLLAKVDPNRPVYFVSIQEEIRLTELWQEPPEQAYAPRQIP